MKRGGRASGRIRVAACAAGCVPRRSTARGSTSRPRPPPAAAQVGPEQPQQRAVEAKATLAQEEEHGHDHQYDTISQNRRQRQARLSLRPQLLGHWRRRGFGNTSGTFAVSPPPSVLRAKEGDQQLKSNTITPTTKVANHEPSRATSIMTAMGTVDPIGRKAAANPIEEQILLRRQVRYVGARYPPFQQPADAHHLQPSAAEQVQAGDKVEQQCGQNFRLQPSPRRLRSDNRRVRPAPPG